MQSRTNYSIKNLFSTIIPYTIIGILGFIKIKVFVSNLSEDIVSLNQLFFQLLGYLALAEAGFGIFTIHKYYKAFAKNDKEEINRVYSTSKIFFKRIGLLILFLAFILSFVVQFLTKANITTWYLQLIFLVFVIKNSVDYFMMTPRFVIQADQKMYKINYLVNLIRILETIFEIILVLCGFNYLVILLPGIVIRVLLNLIINKKIYKEYEWLKSDNVFYKDNIKGISNIITQKIVGVFYTNTDIILISTFISPAKVIVYTTYSYITKFIFDTIFICAQALSPSYADAINHESKDAQYKIFNELNIMFYFIGAFVTVFLYVVFNPLINLWVGGEYLINKLGLILFLGILYMDIARRMMYMTINTEGLFKETKVIIIVEAVLNFILSIFLIRYFGINGVLFGTLLSMVLTTFWYLPQLINKKVFERNSTSYFVNYFISIFIVIVLILLFSYIPIFKMTNVFSWLLGCIFYAFIIGIGLMAIYLILFQSFRNLINRGIYIVSEKMRGNKL